MDSRHLGSRLRRAAEARASLRAAEAAVWGAWASPEPSDGPREAEGALCSDRADGAFRLLLARVQREQDVEGDARVLGRVAHLHCRAEAAAGLWCQLVYTPGRCSGGAVVRSVRGVSSSAGAAVVASARLQAQPAQWR